MARNVYGIGGDLYSILGTIRPDRHTLTPLDESPQYRTRPLTGPRTSQTKGQAFRGRVVWNKDAPVAGALTTGSPDPQPQSRLSWGIQDPKDGKECLGARWKGLNRLSQ